MDLQQKLEAAVAIEDYEVAAILRDQIASEALIAPGYSIMTLNDLRSQYSDEVRAEVQKRMRRTKHKNSYLFPVIDNKTNTVTYFCDGRELLAVTYTPYGPKFD